MLDTPFTNLGVFRIRKQDSQWTIIFILYVHFLTCYINTLRTGLLNCLNARSRGLNNVIQLLYCVSLKIYNKFTNYFCELKFSGNTHQRP